MISTVAQLRSLIDDRNLIWNENQSLTGSRLIEGMESLKSIENQIKSIENLPIEPRRLVPTLNKQIVESVEEHVTFIFHKGDISYWINEPIPEGSWIWEDLVDIVKHLRRSVHMRT